ncbi:restriction endonuclease (plasmid) [Cytobacillus firmus]|nr:restriction endonuclease [Bacillus sp. NTK034]
MLILFFLFFIGLILYHFIEQFKLNKRLNKAGIEEIDLMKGDEFEKYLRVLFDKLGFRVRVTKASNDFGADLILEGDVKVVIQAKRYKKKVGIRAVQEINTAWDYYNAQEAWVITNNFFTTPAIKLAQSSNVKLIDRYELVELILNSKSSSAEKKHFWSS